MSNANNYRIVLHNNMMGMQMPMFAPANQQTTGDEVDLQDIFADYLTEDYSLPDPTSVTSAQQQQQQQVQQQLLAAQQHQQQQHQQLAANAMAAQAQAAAQQQHQHQQQQHHQQLSLPTRQGIKTAWHTGTLPVVQQQQQGGGGGGSQGNGMQQQGQPPAKKMRGEELYLPSEPVQQQQPTHQHQQQMGQMQQMENGGGGGSVGQQNQSVTTGGGGGMGRNNVNAAGISMAHQQQQWALAQAASGFGGLSSRLGFTLPNNGNAVVDMGSNNTVVVVQQQQQQQQQHLPMQQQQQQQQGVMLPLGGVHFPVGIGLKFGAGGTVLSQVGSMADPTTAVNNHVVVNSNIAAMSNNLALALSQGAVNGNDSRLAVSNMQYGVNPMSFPPSSNHLQQPQQPLQPFGIMRQECEEQLASERRLRNREHAKRSRVRKKFMLESLQVQVRGLQDENSTLRMLVQQHIPHEALNIIDTCCSKSVLFADPMGGFDDDDDEDNNNNNNNTRRRPQDQNGNKTKDSDDSAAKSSSPTPLLRSDFSLIESLTSGQQNFVLSDPRLPDNPIVYASSGFYELTGYTREQVLGRNCRFLQGTGTNRKAVDILRTAVANGTDATVCLLNYKADGTPFWNQLFVAALRDGDNCIVNYVGVQTLIEPNAGATALEDKVNAAHPILVGTEEDGDYDKDQDEED
ncbi:hypothetical protein ACHAWU_009779 [Discostella pseudostelligera]|uniref:LOV domain-containing protein n=1 Tax=Discostella pseudostelligera TaxID=259834 RepID=A0ABD3M7T1_9STRA